jgi:hypothetical protein
MFYLFSRQKLTKKLPHFQESSLPDAFPENHWVSPNAITRSRRNGKSPVLNKNSPSSSSHVKSTPALSPENDRTEEKRPVFSLLTSSTAEAQYSVASNTAHPDTFDMVALGNEMNAASFQPDVAMEENPILQPPEMPSTVNSPSTSSHVKSTPALSPENDRTEEKRPVFSLTSSTAEAQYSVAFNTAHPDTFDMVAIGNEMNAASFQPDVAMEENPILQPPEMPSTVTVPESCSDILGFLEPDEVSLSSIRAFHVPFFLGSRRIKLFYEGAILQLRCPRLRMRFGLSTKFSDHAGRPRLSFVVDASPSLCDVLDKCESIVRKVCEDSNCSSDWRSVVTRKHGFVNNPTVRLK